MRRAILVSLAAAGALLLALASGAPGVQAQSLQALANTYTKQRDAGQFPAAEKTAKRMVAIAAKRYGKSHLNYAMSAQSLAVAYANQKRHAEAIPLYQASVAIFEKSYGRSHQTTLATVENLAWAYQAQGRYAEALPLSKRVLAEHEKAFGTSSVKIAGYYFDFATLNKRAAQFPPAAQYYERAASIYGEKLDRSKPDFAKSLYNLGDVQISMARHEEAVATLQEALKAYEQSLGKDHRHYAFTLGAIGNIEKDRGRYDVAEDYLKRAMETLEKASGRDDAYGNVLNSLAAIYNTQDKQAEAEDAYQQVLAIYEKTIGTETVNYGNTLNNLGVVYSDTGRTEEALALFKRALVVKQKMLGKDHPIVADTLNNIADLYRSQKKFEQATKLFNETLEIYEKSLDPDHPRVAVALDSLGFTNYGQGNFKVSADFHRRALAIREKAFGETHPRVATSVLNLANAYFGQNRYDLTVPLYGRAIRILEDSVGTVHAKVAAIHGNLAEVYRREKKYDDALASSREGMRILYESRVRSAAGRETADRGGQDPLRNIYGNFVVISRELTEQEQSREGELAEEAFAASQRHGATSTSAALSQMSARFGTGDEALGKAVRERQDLAARAQALEKTLTGELAKPNDQRDKNAVAKYRQTQADTVAQLEKVSARLEEDFPQYAELTNPAPLAMTDVQKLLGPDEALVSFLVLDRNSYAWAMTADKVRWSKLNESTAEKPLTDRIAALRKSLDLKALEGGGKLFNLLKAHELYNDLLGPVDDMIRDAKQVMLVPSGPLTGLPFNVLVTDKPAKAEPDQITGYADAAWLVKRQAITILPSVSSFRALRAIAGKSKAADPFIGYGDPDFRSGKSGAARGTNVANLVSRDLSTFYTREGLVDVDMLSASLPQLPDTADELRHVAGRLGANEDRVRLGAVATEQAVKTTPLDGYRVVYFATHGLVAGDLEKLGVKAAEPALALTVPKKASDTDDGLLMASEVAKLKLNADWVVLSACNTASGDKPGAEALSGLAKAFFYAGARSMLVSHWPVVSSAAVELTSVIFDSMAEDPTLGRSEALRRAMIAKINDTKDPLSPYPTIWAPFILVGDGGT